MSESSARPLTERLLSAETPLDRAAYERAGGYRALRKALGSMSPQEVQQAVKDSRLRGRGGAGFPTGMKWSFVPMAESSDERGDGNGGDDGDGGGVPDTKYLLANADEMEPGTFKDRLLLEGDPHQLLEGMILAAYAIGASRAYVFLRWAYREAYRTLEKAIAEAYDAGYLGRDVLSSGFSLELDVHVSAGRYMCGEETGLLNALEGRRATPRSKPPYPQVSGLWGKPTIVQNVETLCCVPHIVERGADWFQAISRSGDGGTKIYGVSGKVRRPGAWELPLGTTAREILEEHAGGLRDGLSLQGFLPGGASTDFLTAEHLDVAMDYDGVQEAGSRLGTGTLVILDSDTCPVSTLERFFARESCGWCTPCRDGLPWVEKLLMSIESGFGRPRDLEILQEHVGRLGPGHTFCALAPGAIAPLGSALSLFREAFERHLTEKACPWGGA
jgi:NADH-quinone oxidoreductase subunit F